MQNVAQLKAQCLAKIEAAYTKAEEHFGIEIPRIPVEFSSKLTSTAGSVSYFRGTKGSTKMKLSLPIMLNNPVEFVNDTPGHEAAHHIVNCVYGGGQVQGHGKEWQAVMRMIGQKAKRCHNMKTVKRNTVTAYCDCKEHEITTRRANMMKQGRNYRCNLCKGSLRLGKQTEEVKPTPNARPVRIPAPQMPKLKKGTKADMVREVIRNNPDAGVEQLITIVKLSNIGIPTANVKRYVTENVKRVRGA